jgi:hypothetical protein
MDLPGPEALFKELRSPGTSREEHARKIELAEGAWRSDAQRLPLPRKGQFILEWLLERLLKTRNDDSACVGLCACPARPEVDAGPRDAGRRHR